MKSMRIAYFSDNFFPEISGISDSILTTGEALRAMGHNVVYIGPRYSEKDYAYIHGAEMEKTGGHDPRRDLPTHRLPSLPMAGSPTGQSRIVIPLGTALPFLRAWKPDVIHTQSPFGTGLEALLASRRLKVPLVGTNHTPIEEFVAYVPIIGNALRSFAKRFFAWYYNRCLYITTPYGGLLTSMRDVGLRVPGKAQPNPTPLDAFTPVTNEEKIHWREQRGLPGPTILYAGRLAPEKQIDVVIRAVAKIHTDFPGLSFVVCGHGVARESLGALAKELGVEGIVRFTGYVGFDRLAEFYKASDVFVVMSTAETQCLSLMQAYATGIPGIAARARGLVDYTPEEAGFLVEPGDVDTLAEKLRELLSNEPLRTQMGAAGLRFVQDFSVPAVARAWEDIYRDAISSFSSRSAAKSFRRI